MLYLASKYHFLLKLRNKGKNNLFKLSWFSFVGCNISLKGDNNIVMVSCSAFVEGLFLSIKGSNNKVFIHDSVIFERGGASIAIEDDFNIVIIKNGTVIVGNVHLACIEGTRISIGSNSLIAPAVVIRTGDSHSIYKDDIRINKSADVDIGNKVWVCESALILKGSSIGDNSVLAAGSILTKSFYQPNLILAGVPAQKVKDGIYWNSSRIGL